MSASIHASRSWAVPCPYLDSCLMQREEWPTACSWHPGTQAHPPLSRLNPWEHTRRGGGFSWRYSWRDVALPKAVEWLPVPSHVEIADTLANTVVFLPGALRSGTRTRFSFQGTTDLFSHRSKKVEMHELHPAQTPNKERLVHPMLERQWLAQAGSVRTGDLVGLPSQAKIPLSSRSIRLLVGYE